MLRFSLIRFGTLMYAAMMVSVAYLLLINLGWLLSVTPWFSDANPHPASALPSILSTVFGAFGWLLNWMGKRLPDQAALDEERLSNEHALAAGLEDKLWKASYRDLRDLKFQLIRSIPNISTELAQLDVMGLTNQKYGELSHSDYVIWRNGRCIAVAKILGVLRRAHWERSSYTNVYVGGSERTITNAIWSSNLTSLVDDAKSKRVHLVGVGLETFKHSVDQFEGNVHTSALRSRSLFSALKDTHCSWHSNPNVQVSAIDLGHALRWPEPFNYSSSRDQRAVIVIAISLDERVEEPLQMNQVLSIVINTGKLRGTNLKRYSRSGEPILKNLIS